MTAQFSRLGAVIFVCRDKSMKVKLGDVCERGTSNLRQSDVVGKGGDYPIYGASGYIGDVDFYHQEKSYVAIVKDGAGIGRTMLCPEKSSVIGTMQYLLPKEAILPQYLYYVVKYMHLEKYFSGATIPHIYFKDYKNEQFNLDTLKKQAIIVKILGKCEEVIAARNKQLNALDELIQARFVELFGDPVANPMGWDTDTCKNLTSKIGSGATPKGGRESYGTEGISLIRSMNVYNNRFEYKDLAHITDEQAEKLDNVTIKENDVLLNITGASVARCCIVPKDLLPARVNQHVSIIRCKERLLPEFVACMFTEDNYQRLLWNIATAGGATREAITKQQIEDLVLIVPPVEKQQEFMNFAHQVHKSKLVIKNLLQIYKHQIQM